MTLANNGGKEALAKIKKQAEQIRSDVEVLKKPRLTFPIRSLSNVVYDEDKGTFRLAGNESVRDFSYTTVKTFAQSLRMMALSKMLVETDDIATKRDAYYQSKNWGEAKFDEQPESDNIMDDLEAMLDVIRERLGFIPDEHGGGVAGELVVYDKDPATGQELRIDCTKFGSGAYVVPPNVELLHFETKAKFILAIETTGMFQRLVKHAYWKTADCILVAMGGVPTRACRRFIRKLADDFKLPVYVFTDGDPYGYTNIYRTLKVGSGNAAHLNEYFCVPQAKYLGVTPDDITNYSLPTHPLKDVDIKRAKDAIKNDPFIQHHRKWEQALQKLVKMGVRAEQQALAAHGLNYVIDTYLPEKLRNQKTFLP
jgi:DNA topoisomerase-6 subunit A